MCHVRCAGDEDKDQQPHEMQKLQELEEFEVFVLLSVSDEVCPWVNQAADRNSENADGTSVEKMHTRIRLFIRCMVHLVMKSLKCSRPRIIQPGQWLHHSTVYHHCQ